MKKYNCILFFIFCFTVSYAQNTLKNEYYPLVEEGKTWWYESAENCESDNFIYYGIRIEGEIPIDGKIWKECWYIDAAGQKIIPDPLVLIREEDKRVYVKSYFTDYFVDYSKFDEKDTLFKKVISGFADETYILQEMNDQDEFLIYDFNLGFSQMGSLFNTSINYCKGITPIVGESYIWNSNRGLRLLTIGLSNFNANSEDEYVGEYDCMNRFDNKKYYQSMIESAGYLDDDRRGLFYAPYPRVYCISGGNYAEIMSTYPTPPTLLYITDKSNNILFEGYGGTKPWEVASLQSASKEETHTLQFVNGKIFFKGGDVNIDYLIYNIDGTLQGVYTLNPAEGLDVSNLPKGIYVAETDNAPQPSAKLKFNIE